MTGHQSLWHGGQLYIIDIMLNAWATCTFDWTLRQTDARNDQTCDLLTQKIASD